MLEVHVSTRGQMRPNPGHPASAERVGDAGDEVEFIWYGVKEDPPPAPAAAASSARSTAADDGPTATAIAPFVATGMGQLSFEEGDVFAVIDSTLSWYTVTDAAGATGIVPSNFVRLGRSETVEQN